MAKQACGSKGFLVMIRETEGSTKSHKVKLLFETHKVSIQDGDFTRILRMLSTSSLKLQKFNNYF